MITMVQKMVSGLIQVLMLTILFKQLIAVIIRMEKYKIYGLR
ncbi:unnamed protein product [Paramecium sonneborni]|uniref:Uncharacterized protein n=1 Tax=Paramecium sonneborni TaxID=65129 RepID=A0A8S1N3Q1_9CILI|nr:unnamed protein product [Paramecium sonneborni]